jgi:CBS domain-containing protein
MEMRDLTKEAILINENASFREAISLMVRKQTNSLLVTNDAGELTGEVNVSDLLDAIIPVSMSADDIETTLGNEDSFKEAVKNAEDVPVIDFMRTDIQSVQVDDSLITIAGTAIAHQTAHIPIVDHENRPIGVISRRGLKHILAKYLNIKDMA